MPRVRVRGLGPDEYDAITGLPNKGPALSGEWERCPEKDKRIRRGDDYAGDAWQHVATGEIRWVVPGHIPTYARAALSPSDKGE